MPTVRCPLAALLVLPLPLLRSADPPVSAADFPRTAPLSPEQALAAFKVSPGFHVELAACEPEVVDPVAVAFDENAALYVVEMRDYPERRAEKLSRVRKLEDRDGDGRFEHSTVFLDGLPWATAVACWDGGVFVAATPDLWYAKDTNGDGVADVKRLAFTGFGEGSGNLNVQALVNSLTWGPGQRMHGATAGNGGLIRRVTGGQPAGEAVSVAGVDFSFDPVTLDFRSETSTAQFGLTFDHAGQKYVCANSSHIQWVPWTKSDAAMASPYPLPPALLNIAEDGPAAAVFRISPEEPWRVIRTRWRAGGLVAGLVEGGGRSSGYFTSASGIHIAEGAVCRGDAFIGDAGSNLVHRKTITWTANGPVARRAPGEQSSEFLASPDNWFRPVAFATGPDGGLYVVDFYREFVEHPASLPPGIKRHLDLNSGHDRGRIWRVMPNGAPRRPWPRLGGLDETALAAVPPETGWHTATARRLLHAMGSKQHPPARSAASPEEQHARDRIALALAAGRGDENARAALPSFFTLPGGGASWEPGLAAQLARHALRDRAEAAALFARVTPGRSRLAALQLAAFLGIPLPPEFLAAAQEWLWVTESPEATQLAAVAALAGWQTETLLAIARSARHSPAVRTAALRAAPDAALSLTDSWPEQPAALRTAALEILTAARPAALLEAIGAGRVSPQEIAPHLASILRRTGPASLKEQAARLLPPPPANRQAVVTFRQTALQLDGNPSRGRPLFAQVCATCHQAVPGGTSAGPDRLSFHNLGKPALLLHLLDPNREVAPRYFTTAVTTKSGETAAGVLIAESAAAVRLALPGGQEKEIPRTEITKLDRSSRSLMPEGIEGAWSDQDLADLLAFLVE